MADPKKALEELKRKYTPSFSREETQSSKDNKGTQAEKPAAQSTQRDPKAALETLKKKYTSTSSTTSRTNPTELNSRMDELRNRQAELGRLMTSAKRAGLAREFSTFSGEYATNRKEIEKLREELDWWEDGGYDSEAERLYNAVTSSESALSSKRQSGKTITEELEAWRSNITKTEQMLQNLDAAYKKAPSEALATKYNQLADQYKQAVGEYNNLYSEYESLYNGYNSSLNAYNSFIDEHGDQVGKEDSLWEVLTDKETWALPKTWGEFGKGLAYNTERIGASLLGWGENITDMVGSTFYKGVEGITSLGGLAPNAVSEWAGDAAQSYLDNSVTQRYEDSIRERYNPSYADEKLSSINQTVAPILADIVTGKWLGTLTGTGAGIVDDAAAAAKQANLSKVVFGTSAAGGGANEAYNEGATVGQSIAYGAASGVTEVLVESLAGGIPGLGEGKATQIVSKLMNSPVGSKLLDVAGEGGEEAITTIVAPHLKRAIYDKDAEAASVDEIVESAILGMLTAGILQGGVELPSYLSARSEYNNQATRFDNDTVQAFIDEGLSADPGSKAYKLAQQVQAKVNAGETVTNKDIERLYNQNVKSVDTQLDPDAILAEAAAAAVANETSANAPQSAQERSLALGEETPAQNARTAQASASEAMSAAATASVPYNVLNRQTNTVKQADPGYGEVGTKTFTEIVENGTQSVEQVRSQFQTAYELGKLETPREKISLQGTIQESAYNAGRQDAILSMKKAEIKGATVWGKEGGLIQNEYSAKLDARTTDTLQKIGKATGTKIVFDAQVGGGEANGAYVDSEGTIHIAADATNPVMVVVKHELTHRMQALAPKEYTQFRNYAVQVMSEGRWEMHGSNTAVEAKQNEYYQASKGRVVLTNEQAMDEIAADFTERILTDEQALNDFVNHVTSSKDETTRTMGQKFFQAVREFIDKVKRVFKGDRAKMDDAARDEYGVTISQLEKAEQLWKEAYKAAESRAQKETKNTAQVDGEVQFSLKNVNGKQVVWIENSGLTNKQLNDHSAIAEYIAQHIGDVYTIIESGQKVYIGDDLPGEYTHSGYTSFLKDKKPQVLRAKNKAVSELGLLIETATNRRWEKTKHDHSKDAKYGMYRYDSAFAFPVKNANGTVAKVRSYDVELLIRNASDGKKYLYDIVGIKENTTDAFDLQQRETRRGSYEAAARGSASSDSVAQQEDNVKKEQYSLKDSAGKELTKEQAEYFKDSAIRDANGNLMVMYHGTKRGGFTVFDGGKDYWYFTNDKKYAYTFEGRKANGQLYPSTKEGVEAGYYTPKSYKVYLNVKNPFVTDDIDVIEDALYWDKSLPGKLREKGYDALMLEDMSQVIVLNANQIKDVANKKPTEDQDIRFSMKDSAGRKLSEGQAEYFHDSKVRDKDGNLLVVYHGSGAQFTEFSYNFMSTHGSAEGQGFYFTDKKEMAEGYTSDGGQLLKGYLNITKPLSDSKVTMKRAEVTKLLKAIDPTGDDVVINYDPSGGMGYPSKAWYSRALSATVDAIMNGNESDSEILADIANSGAGTEVVVKGARDVLGYDGYIVDGKYDGATVYVSFTSEQFKNEDNLTPSNNPDIRFSLKDQSKMMRDNARLKEVNAALKAQFQTTKFAKVDPKELKGFARKLRKDYTSDVDIDELQSDLDTLYTYLANGEDGMTPAWDTAYRMAYDVAQSVIRDSSVLNDDMYREYEGVRDYLRTVGISMSA